jgi:HlyD family secretion protein
MLKVPDPGDTESRSSARRVEAILGVEAGGGARKWPRRVISWLLVALVAVVAGLSVWFWSSGEPAVTYVSQPAKRGDLTVIVSATGSVQPTNKVDVSSELSGTVRRVLVDYNSPVTEGQVLAELDTDKLTASVESSQAKLNAALAAVAEAEATVTEAAALLGRAKTLSDRQVASPQDYETAKATSDRAVAAHESAVAQVEVARADLRLNQTNLDKARILSPISGIVLSRDVDPGQTVAASLEAPVLFTIAEDLREMELQVDVDEADVGQIRVGQKATFTVDAYADKSFPADIRDIRFAPETVQGVVTYKAILNVDNAELLLRPGMTATADIVVQQVSDALLVPNAALRFSPAAASAEDQSIGLLQRIIPRMRPRQQARRPQPTGPEHTLFVLRDGEPASIPVVTGATDGNSTEIREGELNPGDAVIIDSNTAAS